MFTYQKREMYPINVNKKDLRLAKYLIAQYGGEYGELSAALTYMNQRYTMKDERGRNLLTDIATEELTHVEMIDSLYKALTKDASIEEMEQAGLGCSFVTHGYALTLENCSGNAFNTNNFTSTGDYKADLLEDMASEQKARTVYENLIKMTSDQDVINVLLFLRQREIVHYNRFKDLLDVYTKEDNMVK